MTFSRRVTLFFVGVAIGIPIAVYIAKDKNVIKSPSQEIREMLQHNKLILTTGGACNMECRGITEDEVKELMINGEVNYSKSEVHARPCKKYTLEGKTKDNQNISVMYGLCTEETRVLSVTDLDKEKEVCDCK